MIRWSPMSSVFSIEPEGITRAWPMVPLISKNTSATQNHAITSRWMRCPTGGLTCVCVFFSLGRFASAFTFHRHRTLDGVLTITIHRVTRFAVRAAFAHFQLHQVCGIHARVARRAEIVFGVTDRLLQSCQRDIAERIRTDKFANLF